jgi:D-alanine-D-alanine ligase
MNRLRILLTFGGRSGEHDVSVISASNILPFFDADRYDVLLLHVQKDGQWELCDRAAFKTDCSKIDELLPTVRGRPVFLSIGGPSGSHLVDAQSGEAVYFDAVFSVLHGANGAGGVMQGLWRTAGIPSTGPSLIGAAIGFDKEVSKRLMIEAGLPVCKYRLLHGADVDKMHFQTLESLFGLPFLMKPANSGSSIGVHKISNETEFFEAARDILQYDKKILAEEFIVGNDLEVHCIGDHNHVTTSIVGETVTRDDFYSYDAKYVQKRFPKNIPADISDAIANEARSLSEKAFFVLEGRGYARMDLFYSVDGRLLLNEINTNPALFNIDHRKTPLPESGITYGKLIDMLIDQTVS